MPFAVPLFVAALAALLAYFFHVLQTESRPLQRGGATSVDGSPLLSSVWYISLRFLSYYAAFRAPSPVPGRVSVVTQTLAFLSVTIDPERSDDEVGKDF